MTDFKKLEEKFHEFLRTGLDEKQYDIDSVKLTENLFEESEAFQIAFGFFSYFMVIENEKPMVYAFAATRMDTEIIAFIDEDSYDVYDVFMGENKEISERYHEHSKKVRKFKNLQDIRKKTKKDIKKITKKL